MVDEKERKKGVVVKGSLVICGWIWAREGILYQWDQTDRQVFNGLRARRHGYPN